MRRAIIGKTMLKVVPKIEAYQMKKSTFILSIIIIIIIIIYPPPNIC
jgi:hypothetical protein